MKIDFGEISIRIANANFFTKEIDFLIVHRTHTKGQLSSVLFRFRFSR